MVSCGSSAVVDVLEELYSRLSSRICGVPAANTNSINDSAPQTACRHWGL